MNAHTPGPWREPYEPNGRGMGWRAGPAWLGSNSTTEETKANARLIAAAPDLLEALKKFVAWSEAERNHEGTTFWQRVEMLRELDASADAAIAKAEGKP